MVILISKNRLTLLSVVLLLLKTSLSVASMNYCTTGMCIQCKLQIESGDRFCTACLISDITTIDGKDAPGGKSEGQMPIANCALLMFAEGSNLCQFCIPGYQRSENKLVCSKIEIEGCISLDGEKCDKCKGAFYPSSSGASCEAIETGAITGCVAYERTAEGAPECDECKFDLLLNEQKTTCDSVDRSDNNFCGYKEDQVTEPSVSCIHGCWSTGGYFSSDALAVEASRILVDSLTLTLGYQVCTKYPDFDTADPFGLSGPGSASNLLSLLSILAFGVVLMFWY